MKAAHLLSWVVLAAAPMAHAAGPDGPDQPTPPIASAREVMLRDRLAPFAVDPARGATIRWDRFANLPRAIHGIAMPLGGEASEPLGLRAARFMAGMPEIVAASDARFVVRDVGAVASGRIVTLAVEIGGLPLEGRSVSVRVDDAGRVTRITSDLVAVTVAAGAVDIGPAAASQAVRARFSVSSTGTPTKVVYAGAGAFGAVAYRVPTTVVPLAGHFSVWVDAATGAILGQAPAAHDQAMQRLPLRTEAP